jgi:NAD-dependent deacetylase
MAKPNAGHRAIAEMEKHVRVTVVTQNVDHLHQEAGSTIVHEVHGSLFEIVTRDGDFVRMLSRGDMLKIAEALGRAQHGWFNLVRVAMAIRRMAGLGLRNPYQPRIILFGDAMAEPAWSNAMEAATRCDCMITVGTSGTVMPAGMLPMEAHSAGAKIITIDPNRGGGDVWLEGTAATVIPRLLDAAFGQPKNP